MVEARIGIIGGSGLYEMEALSDRQERTIKTPYGLTSDPIILGKLEGVPVAFLSRHGKGHRLLPSEIPVRANIYALKSLGVERIISVSAVGSLKEEFRPLDLVVPDQLIDHTRHRPDTFFGNGIVAHVSFAQPFCPVLNGLVYEAARKVGARAFRKGTYLAMEGPQFSTRAESELYRSWDAEVIGMTAIPEAKLAREAEICYSILACVTDYDCWHEDNESVTAEMVFGNLKKNVDVSKKVLRKLVTSIPERRDCGCGSALKDAIATSPDYIPETVKTELSLLIGKYIS